MYLINGPVTSGMISEIIGKDGGEATLGAHSIFLGQVRSDVIDGRKVMAIKYSAYDEMVNIEIEKIRDIIFSEFDDTRKIEIIHSTGLVKAGEISLLVMVSALHRHHAIEACGKLVELIKERVPIWKKEIFEDNSSRWGMNL